MLFDGPHHSRLWVHILRGTYHDTAVYQPLYGSVLRWNGWGRVAGSLLSDGRISGNRETYKQAENIYHFPLGSTNRFLNDS